MNGKEKKNVRELAMEISLTSLGSSQTLPRPHLRTLEASLFWSLSETIVGVLPPSFPFLSATAVGREAKLLWMTRFYISLAFAVLEFRPRVSPYDWAFQFHGPVSSIFVLCWFFSWVVQPVWMIGCNSST